MTFSSVVQACPAVFLSFIPSLPPSLSLPSSPHPSYFIFSFLIIRFGEGNGSPLQYYCLGKSHGWRSLVGCSPWGRWESDTTGWLHFHFSLSCIGGHGNPLQCSCLENPRDRGAWWAAIYGVAQSRTRLKWLSSSSSSSNHPFTYLFIAIL